MLVPDAAGPLSPAADFQMFGRVFISHDEPSSITISVSVRGPNFPPTAGVVSVAYWAIVKLIKHDLVVYQAPPLRDPSYFQPSPPMYRILGSRTMVLPALLTSPGATNDTKLVLEGSYIIRFTDAVRVPMLRFKLDAAVLKKEFLIPVVYNNDYTK